MWLFTKKQKRYESDPNYQNISFCKDIKNINTVKQKITNNYKEINLNNQQNQINIIPYCGEKVNISESINKANASSINENLVKELNKNLNVNINFNSFLNDGIIKKKDSYHSYHSPQKFKKILINSEKIKKILNGKKHAFIVVHSILLRKLTRLFGFDSYFDNLDMIQLHYQNDNQIIFQIREFEESYITTQEKPFTYTSNDNHNSNGTNIFLVRHCVACHNILPKTLKSKFLAHALQRLKGELGFSLYALCHPHNIQEIKKKKEILKNILLKECGNLDDIQFGSSIILRAIITSILFAKILYKD